MLQKTFFTFALCLLIAWPTIGLADTEASAKKKFLAGVQAFQQENLVKARTLLEAAAETLSSKALTYNLGVVYYRLGEYDKSRQMFETLLPTNQRALAFYNLGLIALAEDDTTKARHAFRNAAKNSSKENLTKLAYGQLKELGSELPSQPWQALVSLGAGYEDNIALFPDSAATTLDSSFFESVNAVSGYPLRSGNHALKILAQLYGRRYNEYKGFDTYLARLELAWAYLPDGYRFNLGIGGDQLWQGSESREQRMRVFTDFQVKGCLRDSVRDRCTLGLEAEQVEAAERYRPYDGQRYQFETKYRTRFGDWTWDVRYRVDYNDRRDLDTGTESFSVSPLTQTARLGLDYEVTSNWSLGASANYGFRHYQTDHRLQIPEGLLTIRREDNRFAYSIKTAYKLTSALSMSLDVEQVQNNSNIDRYDYDRRTATLSLAVHL